EGETCVKIVCKGGSHLSDDNRCERDFRVSSRGPATHSPATPRRPALAVEGGPAGATRAAVNAHFSGNYRYWMGPLLGCYDRAIQRMSPEVARAWCSRKPTC